MQAEDSLSGREGPRPGVPCPACVLAVLVLVLVCAWGVPALAASTPRFKSATLTHGPVSYELVPEADGSRGPRRLVVLLPGFAVPMVVWDATVPALVAEGFTVLRFDLYGRGRSARPRIDYRPEVFAEQLWELLGKLKLPARFDVVASSMGAAVAAVFAARHPDTLRRVVLVGPVGLAHDLPAFSTFLRAPGIGQWYFTRRFRPVMNDHLQDNLRADVCAYPSVMAEFRRQLAVPGTAEAMFSTFRHTLLADVRDDYRALGRRHLPTLAIWGRDDRLVSFKTTRRKLERVIPHVEFATIRASGHLPQLEAPRAFNKLVKEFLRR